MKKVIKYPLVLLFFCILGFILYSLFIDTEKKEMNKILKNTNDDYAIIDKYFIYGRSLNIEGHIDMVEEIKDISLVLKNFNEEEIEYDLKYEINDKLEFNISDEINTGINLDNIDVGNYYVLVKITSNDEIIYYYSIKNETEY